MMYKPLTFLFVICTIIFAEALDQITSPKNGDVFFYGDTVTIKMSVDSQETAGMGIWMGKKSVSIPDNLGFHGTFSPATTHEVKFIVPPFYTVPHWDDNLSMVVEDTINFAYDSCQIKMFLYNRPSSIIAQTNGYFKIAPSTALIRALVQPNGKYYKKTKTTISTSNLDVNVDHYYSANGKIARGKVYKTKNLRITRN